MKKENMAVTGASNTERLAVHKFVFTQPDGPKWCQRSLLRAEPSHDR